jgi:hypothetical protein
MEILDLSKNHLILLTQFWRRRVPLFACLKRRRDDFSNNKAPPPQSCSGGALLRMAIAR